MNPDMTVQEHTDSYRREFAMWQVTPYASGCCDGAAAIHTNRRAAWVCSNCGADCGLAVVLQAELGA